jgi:hypothetical protein
VLSVISIRVYDGKGHPMGVFQTGVDAVQIWLSQLEKVDESLVTARPLVDPDDENANYDWDLWVKGRRRSFRIWLALRPAALIGSR